MKGIKWGGVIIAWAFAMAEVASGQGPAYQIGNVGIGNVGNATLPGIPGQQVDANKEFLKCVNDQNYPAGHTSPNADCTHIDPGLPAPSLRVHPLRLYQGSSEATGDYDADGKWKCAVGSNADASSCGGIFRVEAWFAPHCPKNASGNQLQTCVKVESFTVSWRVRQIGQVPGMMPFKPIETGTTERPPIRMQMSALMASAYQEFKCAHLYPAPDPRNKWIVLGVDATGQPICGEDPNQQTIDKLKEEMCKVKVQQVWQNGGSTQFPCDLIQIEKVFKLTSNPSKTTTDCTNQGGSVYKDNQSVSNLNAYPGGKITVNGTVTDEASFNKSKYDIFTTSPTFDCKKQAAVPATGQSWSSNASLTLPPSYVPGTLTVKLVGGGGGGSGSGLAKGGYGGAAGALATSTLAGAPNANCTITIGGGGSGGEGDGNCNEWPKGTGGGGTTSISCNTGGSLSAAGGAAGGQCGGGPGGTAGAHSPLNGTGGGTVPCCGAGGGGSYYGAGGAGGDTRGDKCGGEPNGCGKHSGGSGYGGYAEANWQVYELRDFMPQ